MVVETRDAAQHPTMHRTGHHQKDPAPKAQSTQAEKPAQMPGQAWAVSANNPRFAWESMSSETSSPASDARAKEDLTPTTAVRRTE